MVTTNQIFGLAREVLEELFEGRELDAIQISVWREVTTDPLSKVNVRFVIRVKDQQKSSALELTHEDMQATSESLRAPMLIITKELL